MSTTTFFCNLNVPILVGEDRYKYVPIVGVFRAIAMDDVDAWVMHADGRPRSDRELAAEVLVEIRRPLGATGRTAPLPFLRSPGPSSMGTGRFALLSPKSPR